MRERIRVGQHVVIVSSCPTKKKNQQKNDGKCFCGFSLEKPGWMAGGEFVGNCFLIDETVHQSETVQGIQI